MRSMVDILFLFYFIIIKVKAMFTVDGDISRGLFHLK